MNKEEIYDSQISPLMQQVIAISKEHGHRDDGELFHWSRWRGAER